LNDFFSGERASKQKDGVAHKEDEDLKRQINSDGAKNKTHGFCFFKGAL
jgi:hypothetical protein